MLGARIRAIQAVKREPITQRVRFIQASMWVAERNKNQHQRDRMETAMVEIIFTKPK